MRTPAWIRWIDRIVKPNAPVAIVVVTMHRIADDVLTGAPRYRIEPVLDGDPEQVEHCLQAATDRLLRYRWEWMDRQPKPNCRCVLDPAERSTDTNV